MSERRDTELRPSKKEAIEFTLREKRLDRSYADIKKDLKSKGWSDIEIKEIVKDADHELLDSLIEPVKVRRKINNKLLGWFLIITGMAVTISTYIGVVDLGNSFILLYGPVLSGLALLSKDARDRSKNSKFRRDRGKNQVQ